MRKASGLVLVAVLAALVVVASPISVSARQSGKTGKQARWHGTLVRISTDGSTFTVRKGSIDKEIHVNADTQYTKAEGKKVENIEKDDIKEGDDIICLGKYEKGEFVATRVDKRLK
jgi:hypothetical protein